MANEIQAIGLSPQDTESFNAGGAEVSASGFAEMLALFLMPAAPTSETAGTIPFVEEKKENFAENQPDMSIIPGFKDDLFCLFPAAKEQDFYRQVGKEVTGGAGICGGESLPASGDILPQPGSGKQKGEHPDTINAFRLPEEVKASFDKTKDAASCGRNNPCKTEVLELSFAGLVKKEFLENHKAHVEEYQDRPQNITEAATGKTWKEEDAVLSAAKRAEQVRTVTHPAQKEKTADALNPGSFSASVNPGVNSAIIKETPAEINTPVRMEVKKLTEELPGLVISELKAGHEEKGTKGIVVQLEPQELGRIEVKLTVKDGLVSVKISADNTEAKLLLENGMNQLKQSFQEQGIRYERIDVDIGNGFSGDFSRDRPPDWFTGGAGNVKPYWQEQSYLPKQEMTFRTGGEWMKTTKIDYLA